MKKVKIEIDMPHCCGECPCGHYQDECSYCGLIDYYDKKNEIDQYSLNGKPEWCPLLENPKKQ